MTAVDIWKAAQVERLELTAAQAASEDPTQRGEIASCPTCSGPLRIDLDTLVRSCDLHGDVDPAWQTYRIVEAA